MNDPLILVRSLHIAATVLAAGTVSFLVLVAEPAARTTGASAIAGVQALRRSLTRTIWAALGVALVSGVLWLVLLASDILGTSIRDVCLHGGAWQVANETRFGLIAGVRAALALLLGLLLLWPARRGLALAAAAGLIALVALSGHAGATPDLAGRVYLASDMVHLISAGAWLGGLPALAMLLSQARVSSDPAWRAFATAATHRFSLLGILCVGALLASGAVNSWNGLAGPRDLVATVYGQLILLKIAMFIAMTAIAAVNRYHLTPRLPAPAAMWALQRNSLTETGLGLCVLLFVGALGTIEPSAHVHPAPIDIPPDAAFTHIHSTEVMADVTINPGRAGRVQATIRLSHEDSSDFTAKTVTFALDPSVAGLHTVERTAVHRLDGTWQTENIEIPQPGIWTVRVIVAPVTGNPIVLDAPIVIER